MRKGQLREQVEFYQAESIRYQTKYFNEQERRFRDDRAHMSAMAKERAKGYAAQHDVLSWDVRYYAEFYVDGELMDDFNTPDRKLIDHCYDHWMMAWSDGLMKLTEQRSRRI